MHCELVIPGLFGAAEAAHAGARFAALELLLARGRSRSAPAQPLEGWLHEAFELGDGPFPAGALTALACGVDPGAAFWARADPVHLQLMHDRFVMAPSAAFDLSPDEAEALCGALQRHFSAMNFTACEPRRWCARLPEALALEARNPLELAGRAFDPPREAASVLNEAQMVLHEHPVNAAREARGEPALNSLWLWGAGRLPRGARCPWRSVAADDPSVRGAAQLAGARYRPLARSAGDWLEQLPEDGRHLAVLDALRAPIAPGREACLEELERQWFEPLLAALRAGRIGMVTLHVPDGAEGFSCETIRADLCRFWRLPKSIEHYA